MYLTVAIFVQVKDIFPAVPFIDLEIDRTITRLHVSHGTQMPFTIIIVSGHMTHQYPPWKYFLDAQLSQLTIPERKKVVFLGVLQLQAAA